jgi:hypothetical protein
MLDSEKIERQIRDLMLSDLEEEDLFSRVEDLFGLSQKRDCRISETLEELLAEVDRLILLADLLDGVEEEDRIK